MILQSRDIAFGGDTLAQSFVEGFGMGARLGLGNTAGGELVLVRQFIEKDVGAWFGYTPPGCLRKIKFSFDGRH